MNTPCFKSDIKPISQKAKIFMICNLLWVIIMIKYTIYNDDFNFLSYLELIPLSFKYNS